ncbi:MAG: ABC transporter ATP-binding protein, partial [Synergistaceae bacterium]|nr:ABC transporter ATP-binding protein [Synergistaceae bacterium]
MTVNSQCGSVPGPLLDVRSLKKYFDVTPGFNFGRPRKYLRAVDGVSFSIKTGETLGLVGESGCGKSTIGNCIIRLLDPTGGDVFFEGQNI